MRKYLRAVLEIAPGLAEAIFTAPTLLKPYELYATGDLDNIVLESLKVVEEEQLVGSDIPLEFYRGSAVLDLPSVQPGEQVKLGIRNIGQETSVVVLKLYYQC